MLAAATFALGFTAPGAFLSTSQARASAPSMSTPGGLFADFTETGSPDKGPLSMNFAANMGDNARIPVEKKYKPRIVPETKASDSWVGHFLNDPPKPIGKHSNLNNC